MQLRESRSRPASGGVESDGLKLHGSSRSLLNSHESWQNFLGCEAYATQQALEARVGAQLVEFRGNTQILQLTIVRFIGFFKGRESLFPFTRGRVEHCQFGRRDMIVGRL